MLFTIPTLVSDILPTSSMGTTNSLAQLLNAYGTSTSGNMDERQLSFRLGAPPALELRAKGHSLKHPVVIVPGITSVGLEVWEGHPCMADAFRTRIWGETTMFKKLLLKYVQLL